MSFTFTQLRDSIKEYSENTEITFVNNLKNIVRSVEDRIFTLVDLEFFRKNASGAMTSGTQFMATPDDYLSSFSLSIVNSSSKELELKF